MTNRALFTDAEWKLLVRLPRWVVAASSAAQTDTTHRTAVEVEAGLIAVSQGRDLNNPFVHEVTDDAIFAFDDSKVNPAAAGIRFTELEAALAAVLGEAESVIGLVDAKVSAADAAAYRRWLLAISAVVVKAARTGDVLGFGGELVTESEHRFHDRLAALLQR